MNAEKTKVMKMCRTDPGQTIQVEGKTISEVTEFSYQGSIPTHNGTFQQGSERQMQILED